MSRTATPAIRTGHHVGSDVPFFVILAVISAPYLILIIAMLVADAAYMMRGAEDHVTAWPDAPWVLAWLLDTPIGSALADADIQYSIKLTLISCTMTAIISVWVAVPVGYLLSRYQFVGRNLIDAMLDIPIVLPPLVVGLSLLILFQYLPIAVREAVVYQIPAVILAQFMVACAFAVRIMRATFDQIDARREQVALTLGCTRAQAFGRVVLPETKRGMLTAAPLANSSGLPIGNRLSVSGNTAGIGSRNAPHTAAATAKPNADTAASPRKFRRSIGLSNRGPVSFSLM